MAEFGLPLIEVGGGPPDPPPAVRRSISSLTPLDLEPDLSSPEDLAPSDLNVLKPESERSSLRVEKDDEVRWWSPGVCSFIFGWCAGCE